MGSQVDNSLTDAEINALIDAKIATIFAAGWVSKSNNTVYQATTPGILIVINSGGVTNNLVVKSDGSNPPVQEVVHAPTRISAQYTSGCTPIKKNDYYKVNDADVILFLPLV